MRRRTRLLLASLAIMVAGLAPTSSSAHDASVYYPRWWQQDLSVNWKFTVNVPTTSLRDRVKDAAATWNALPPIMHFVKQSGDYGGFPVDSCPDTYQKDAVHWGNIDGKFGTHALVRKCLVGSNEIFTFQIKLDSSENWYTGTSTPAPSGTLDTQAVATHEFGHATGFSGPYNNGHFDPNATLCTDNPKHTMCPFFNYGDSYFRSLEQHDEHTFFNKYP